MSDANNKFVHTMQQFTNNETYSEDSDDRELIILTNTAVFLHENSNRIETELQFLEEQVRKLQELDVILESVKEELHRLSITKNEHPSALAHSSTAVSYTSECAVWDESNSVTTVANNY